MSKYKCPVSADHEGWGINETGQESPHRGEVVCAECDQHIKWASRQDMIQIGTELDLGVDLRTAAENFKKHAEKAIDALRKAGLI